MIVNFTPSFFFPHLLLLGTASYGIEYPFGQLGSAIPTASPLNSLCIPSLFADGSV